MGLDEPWYVQFWQYLSGIFTGRTFGSGADMIVCNAPCLGYSFRLNAQVSELITKSPAGDSVYCCRCRRTLAGSWG